MQSQAQISEVVPVVVSIGEAEAKAFIYYKESSNNLAAQNSGGCKGLGQDCNGQLIIDCPNWQTDYDCQDAFFTRYAVARYGSWAGAYNFWQSHNWY